MNVLVVPSNREACIREFLSFWSPLEWEIIVVEDGPECTFKISDVHHVSWKQIEQDLGEDAWIISRKDSAIRSYGFLLAYRMGADYIFTLDDDCLPDNGTFISGHLKALQPSRWEFSVPGFHTRGMPYMSLGTADNVMLNMGLWNGTPDLDSVHFLQGNESISLPSGNRLMPKGQYFPLCGMNLCFKSNLTPLMYFPLMGENYPYRRFDDIWCGIIMKKICDHLGWLVSVGEPFVFHRRKSNVFENLVKEAPGIKANEDFWQVIDEIELLEHDPIRCLQRIAFQLMKSDGSYFCQLGKAISIWSRLFE